MSCVNFSCMSQTIDTEAKVSLKSSPTNSKQHIPWIFRLSGGETRLNFPFLLHHFYITPVFFFLFHSSAGKNKNKNKSYHWSLDSCSHISTEAWVPGHVFEQSLCVFMEYHLISRHNYAWKDPRTLSLPLPLTNRLQNEDLLTLETCIPEMGTFSSHLPGVGGLIPQHPR